MKKYTKWGVLLLVLALVLSFALGCEQEAQDGDDDVEGDELVEDNDLDDDDAEDEELEEDDDDVEEEELEDEEE
ncbi:MAG: hypothetical protein GX364_02795 [Firmicutes bacterium]|jgi:hypothetical protein|nr:hypothetical protein [Bacillota bacterium]